LNGSKRSVPGIYRNAPEFRECFDACSFSYLTAKRASRFLLAAGKVPVT